MALGQPPSQHQGPVGGSGSASPPNPPRPSLCTLGWGGQRPGCSPWWEMRILPPFLFPNRIPFLPPPTVCHPALSGHLSPMYQGYPEPLAGHKAAPCANRDSQWPRLPPQRTRPWPHFGLPVLPVLDQKGALVSATGTDASAPGSRGSAARAQAAPLLREAALRQPPRSEAGEGGEELETRTQCPASPSPTAPRRKGMLGRVSLHHFRPHRAVCAARGWPVRLTPQGRRP